MNGNTQSVDYVTPVAKMEEIDEIMSCLENAVSEVAKSI